MVKKVDKNTLQKIAHLARLKVNPEEEERLIGDLNNILEWVDQLNELDTDQIEPLTHMSDEVNQFRKDVSENKLDKKSALRLSPDHDENFFKVPKVVKKP